MSAPDLCAEAEQSIRRLRLCLVELEHLLDGLVFPLDEEIRQIAFQTSSQARRLVEDLAGTEKRVYELTASVHQVSLAVTRRGGW